MPFDIDTFKARLYDITSYLRPFHEEVREDRRFYALKQWSDEDVEALKDEQRPALTFDRTRPIIDSVSGSEITSRFEPKFLPRNMSSASTDSPLADMMSEFYRWSRQQSRAEHWQSLAFKDTAICGVGATEKFMDYDDNPEGRIATRRVDVLELGWDPSSTDTNMLDARYVVRGRWIPLDEFKELFPDKADEFDAYRVSTGGKIFESLQSPHNQSAAWMYKNGDSYFDQRTRKVLVFEYQWYERERENVVYTSPNEWQWMTDDELRQLIEQGRQQALKMGQPEPVIDYVEKSRKKFYRAFVSGDMLLDESPAPVDSFTYKFITGFRDESEDGRVYYFGLMRPMRDPQRWANKFLSQAVHIFASNPKGALIYETGAFANPAKAAKEWAKPNGIIEVLQGRKEAIDRVEPGRMPTGVEFLMQMALQGVPTSVGISEEYFVGTAGDLKRTASSAVTSVQQRALTTLSTFFDALRLYIKEDGSLTLKFVREYVPEGQLMRVVGEDGQAQLIPFTRQWAAHEYDIVVEDSPASKNAQEEFVRKLIEHGYLAEMQKSGVPLPPSIADAMPLPSTAKQEWREALVMSRELMKAQVQMQMLQMQMQMQAMMQPVQQGVVAEGQGGEQPQPPPQQ